MNTTDTSKRQWPALLDRYVQEMGPTSPEYYPRQVRRRYHGQDVTLWHGLVNVADVEGYVENLRLKFYLNRWRRDRGDATVTPTTEQIYEIMVEADREEPTELRKPFHVERIAQSIARNGVQEPIVVYAATNAKAELWDGNRRFFGTMHILKDHKFADDVRDQARWIPAYVVTSTGLREQDERLKHFILTELNFVEKDHIPWPAYVKAEQIALKYRRLTADDPTDPFLSRKAKEQLAKEYGLKGWRLADRWIKMYDLAEQFKEYHEEEHHRSDVEVDLRIQEKFEYFDELSKPGVWGVLRTDPDARDEVFCWLWDGKFQAFPDVRSVPKILADPAARRIANGDDVGAVRRAIKHVLANDPENLKSKEAANEKIVSFAQWIDSFKREDYHQITPEALEQLRLILEDIVKILAALQDGAKPVEAQ